MAFMRIRTSIAIILASASAGTFAKIVHVDEHQDGFVATSSDGDCVVRDFSRISPANRARVQYFWFYVVQAHGAEDRQRMAEMQRAMKPYSVGVYQGREQDAQAFFQAQREQRERIQRNSSDEAARSNEAYRQRYNQFMASLPPADRAAASGAMAIQLCPRLPRPRR